MVENIFSIAIQKYTEKMWIVIYQNLNCYLCLLEKKFLERIMKETILFPLNGFVRGKLDSSLACENMDFVKHFLYNLSEPSYEEYVYLSNFNNDDLYSELKNDPKLADTFIQHTGGLISEVIRYSLNLENLSEIKDAISKYKKSILYQEILTYHCGEPICLEV